MTGEPTDASISRKATTPVAEALGKVPPEERASFFRNLEVGDRISLLITLGRETQTDPKNFSSILRSLMALPAHERRSNFEDLGTEQQIRILCELSITPEAPAPTPRTSAEYKKYRAEFGDPYVYYRTHLAGETRGLVQTLDPNLWDALKRYKYADKIPYYEPYGSDPLGYAKEHYPHLSAGQLAQVNGALYQYLYSRDLHTSLQTHTSGEPQYRRGEGGVRRPYWGREAKAWAIIATAIEHRVSMNKVLELLEREGFSSLRDKTVSRDILFEDLGRFGVKITKPEEALSVARERVVDYGDVTAAEYARIERALAKSEQGIRWDLSPVAWVVLRRLYQTRLIKGESVRSGIVSLDTVATAFSKHGLAPIKGETLTRQALEQILITRFGKLSLRKTHEAIVAFADTQEQWLIKEDIALVRPLMQELFNEEPKKDELPPAPPPPPPKEVTPLETQYNFSASLDPDKLFVYYQDGRKTASPLTPQEYIELYLAGQFEWQLKRGGERPYDYPEIFPKIKQ